MFNGLKLKICFLFMLSINIFLSACVVVRPPAELTYVKGAKVDSLSSNASLSYTSNERTVSGSGVIMFQKPGDMRAVILSPFGSVLQEVYLKGDLVTIVDSGNAVAFSGKHSDLPEKGDLSGWRHIHWLIDIDSPDPVYGNSTVSRTNNFGQLEKAVFENGMLMEKSTAEAGKVTYGNYTSANGVAFPLEIKYETAAGEKFTIQLEEPEINLQMPTASFVPVLDKLRVYPLSSLRR